MTSFSCKNEKGIPLWKLIAKGTKTVTRRPNPSRFVQGHSYAVQPTRGKKAVCVCGMTHENHPDIPEYVPLRIIVLSVQPEATWLKTLVSSQIALASPPSHLGARLTKELNKEGEREGFGDWQGLQRALDRLYRVRPVLDRIEFKIDDTL